MSTGSGVHQARSAARRKALQILFQSEITGQSSQGILEEGLTLEEVGLPCDFTRLLLVGVASHAVEVDDLIAQTSEHWTLERMPLVDKSILRIATYEMLHVDDVPHSVSINEAVELAKSFGGEDESSRFVNGVLGRIATCLGASKPPSAVLCSARVSVDDEQPADALLKSERKETALHG
ncbi:MAG: transcription antitermination factor NusB [Coriobacteriales bacterium]|nr:transcription antitermination factor NusB [Coriobacteriales bacterium]